MLLGRRSGLSALGGSLLITACTERPLDPVSVVKSPPAHAAAAMAAPPSRASDSPLPQWSFASDSLLWRALEASDSTLVVGLKAPGSVRGTWKGQTLVSKAQQNVVLTQLVGNPELRFLASDTLLPHVFVRVSSLGALHRLRGQPFVDFVEPRSQQFRFFDSVPCSNEAYTGTAYALLPIPGVNYGVDYVPTQYYTHLIDGAWAYTTGSGVTVGSTDTGIDQFMGATTEWAPGHFSEGLSTGRAFSYVNIAGGIVNCSHGSKSAGIIAAPRNGISMVGVAYSSSLIGVFSYGGVVYPSSAWGNAVSSIRTAASLGARVISMPWGLYDPFLGPVYSPAVAAEISYWAAPGAGRDVLFVGAAGTSPPLLSQNWVVFPAAMPEVLAVSGANPVDPMLRPSWANYGAELDIIALTEELTTGMLNTSGGGFAFTWLGGSSGATALVTGVAALVRSRYPTISQDSVRKRIVQTSGSSCGKFRAWHLMVNAEAAVGGLCVVNGTPNGTTSISFDRIDLDPRTSTIEQYCVTYSGGVGPISLTWTSGLPSSAGSTANCRRFTFSRGTYTKTISAVMQDQGRPGAPPRSYGTTVTVTEIGGSGCPTCARISPSGGVPPAGDATRRRNGPARR